MMISLVVQIRRLVVADVDGNVATTTSNLSLLCESDIVVVIHHHIKSFCWFISL